jgi:NADP-dependent 3-hydroxy acid dehydrogenase YdfG
LATTHRTLNGKVAAITGAARGIGRATAQALAAKGVKVGIGDLDGDVAEQAAREIGPNARGYSLDVTVEESFESFVDAVEGDLGEMDILINNAGIMLIGRFMDETPQMTDRQNGVNIQGVLTGCRIALQRFTSRRSGHIVNLASAAGKGGYGGMATYCGTKGFVIGFSEGLRGELRGTGVDVTMVLPGFVDTELAVGLKHARGVKTAAPSDVADVIVDALEHPRFEVWVPKSSGPITRTMTALPRRARDAVERAFGADSVALESDLAAREAYNRRSAGADSEQSAAKTTTGARSD